MEKKKTIYELQLHEIIGVEKNVNVMRVHGGWIYQVMYVEENGSLITTQNTFVPYEEEQNQIMEVEFEEPGEQVKKQSDAFEALMDYFEQGMKNSDEPFQHEHIKGAFQCAFSIAELGTTLRAHEVFGVPFKEIK